MNQYSGPHHPGELRRQQVEVIKEMNRETQKRRKKDQVKEFPRTVRYSWMPPGQEFELR